MVTSVSNKELSDSYLKHMIHYAYTHSARKLLQRFFMIRFRLKELMAEKSFKEGKPTSLVEVATQTGIARSTLNRIANVRGYSTSTDVIDKLCEYFDCNVEELLQHISEKGE